MYFKTPSSVLLISPRTYSYHEILSRALRCERIECIWLDERPYSHTLFKIFSRISNTLARRLSKSIYLKHLISLRLARFSPTHVLVIKGEAIHPSVIKYMRFLFPQAKFILYFWDAAANLPGHRSILPYFDAVASFDYRDCEVNGWHHCPLFSGNSISPKPGVLPPPCEPHRLHDWSFVGVVHSDRLEVLNKLCHQSDSCLSYYLYIYFPSIFHVFYYFLRSPSSFLRLYPYIHMHALAPAEVERIYSASRCVVDIHHPRQTGLTMRTIESVITGVKVVTTNTYVTREAFFHPSRILIIERSAPLVPPSFAAEPILPISDSVSDRYQVTQWIFRLLSL